MCHDPPATRYVSNADIVAVSTDHARYAETPVQDARPHPEPEPTPPGGGGPRGGQPTLRAVPTFPEGSRIPVGSGYRPKGPVVRADAALAAVGPAHHGWAYWSRQPHQFGGLRSWRIALVRCLSLLFGRP